MQSLQLLMLFTEFHSETITEWKWRWELFYFSLINQLIFQTFHTGTKTWRKCRWGRIIESGEHYLFFNFCVSVYNDVTVLHQILQYPRNLFLFPALLISLKQLYNNLWCSGDRQLSRRFVPFLSLVLILIHSIQAFPLSDSLLIARSPDNLLIVHNDKVRRVRVSQLTILSLRNNGMTKRTLPVGSTHWWSSWD